MTSQEGDDFGNGVFAVGGWTDLTANFDDNYYFSIRRFPYSADMEKSPLTFRHIGDDQELPEAAPANPNAGGSNSEVHNAGEVWAVTDGIVAAVGMLDADDLPDVWAGFAKRGMGARATSPSPSSSALTGVVESFDVPAARAPAPVEP